ncbi:hypothetical protein [Cupriavidus pampae]|uniref:Uncharacterized protein n=1 Tax=Cupriavidus pampae TaxID=659251 RepID=A0ABM8WYG8_9BURK|nr:hypothetical protein [Cupriavidus pampae]CAG9172627.1 hypothetical protein LMG32289_02638 [Cupriavidus pampae]
MKTLKLLAAALLASLIATPVFASGGTGTYRLPWNTKGQVLEYRSCGCGDSCWVAQVRNVQTKAVVATLRCDCEQLHYSTKTRAEERQMPEACPSPDKKETFIQQTLKTLLE